MHKEDRLFFFSFWRNIIWFTYELLAISYVYAYAESTFWVVKTEMNTLGIYFKSSEMGFQDETWQHMPIDMLCLSSQGKSAIP